MSSDNFVLIKKVGISWVGQFEQASSPDYTYIRKCFKAGSLEEAVKTAQEFDTEYGYRVEGF